MRSHVHCAGVPGQVCNAFYHCDVPGGCYIASRSNETYPYNYCSLQYAKLLDDGPVTRGVPTTFQAGERRRLCWCSRGLGVEPLFHIMLADLLCSPFWNLALLVIVGRGLAWAISKLPSYGSCIPQSEVYFSSSKTDSTVCRVVQDPGQKR